jgi:hypothetical protein
MTELAAELVEGKQREAIREGPRKGAESCATLTGALDRSQRR